MERAVVFLGPTLPVAHARAVLDAEYLPPAAQGDVLRAALRRPPAIALVDGVFERVPAVWHKEILYALEQGIHVYGAASMGALRAAELDRFGMRGVGEIYRLYAEGVLEDDDEVAVAHAGEEDGFTPLSDAMVDVRATLAAAVAEGVVPEETAAEIEARVKRTFYPRRFLPSALDAQNEEHERLRAWLPGGRVDRKRLDAFALLRVVRHDLEAGLEPFRPSWQLQWTRYWEDALRAARLAAGDEPFVAADGAVDALLDELRLDPARFERLAERSLLTALAGEVAARTGADASSSLLQTALDEERRARGLGDPERMREWLDERQLEEAEIPELASRLAAVRWARRAYRDEVAEELLLALRLEDDYPELAERATEKRVALAEQPSDAPLPTDEELVSWYFTDRLNRDVPAALDEWATRHGWRGANDFVRALRGEWAVSARPGIGAP
ncbi:MAG TPA: TfuA-like protein [Gaiellaceae bacterium]|nr:TfuA-like protein [Gaiellaceae bacterium]